MQCVLLELHFHLCFIPMLRGNPAPSFQDLFEFWRNNIPDGPEGVFFFVDKPVFVSTVFMAPTILFNTDC